MAREVQGNKQQKLTIDDVAKALGLSKTTISRAISGKGRISEETRNKVQEYIKLHNYIPNSIAKGLAQSKTYNIGVILPQDNELTDIPFFQHCLMGICEMAASLDYDVIITTTTEMDISLLERIINNHKVDGVILTRPLINDKAISFLKEVEIPYVVIGTVQDNSILQIDSNHVRGCYELTSLLLQRGVRKVGLLLGDESHAVNVNRYDGFMKALKENRVLPEEGKVIFNVAGINRVNKAVEELIARKTECIFCGDDSICTNVLLALEHKGINVPKEIKVASFYDSIYLEKYHIPITALNIDNKELGMVTSNKLIKLLEGKEVGSKALMNYEILLKRSTMQ